MPISPTGGLRPPYQQDEIRVGRFSSENVYGFNRNAFPVYGSCTTSFWRPLRDVDLFKVNWNGDLEIIIARPPGPLNTGTWNAIQIGSNSFLKSNASISFLGSSEISIKWTSVGNPFGTVVNATRSFRVI